MTLYEILEVPSTATAAQIKVAYRRLALKYHPDRGGKKADFQRVNTAYEVLSDPKLKADYDLTFAREGGRPRVGVSAKRTGTRTGSIFGPMYDEFISKLDTEGVTMGNVDDLVDMLKQAANETKANVQAAVRSPTKYDEILAEIFGDHVTFGPGR